ncbi:unnamed protein product [Ambrosiozyma monospora]|uniref:Unnamed protein product n=1 Tax=Ambrosiozyma monospora TaxID=43982 RepID=A0ACB5T1M7_AMBMO|nr:unnamed protein product [Ambrosiozyma monospora]
MKVFSFFPLLLLVVTSISATSHPFSKDKQDDAILIRENELEQYESSSNGSTPISEDPNRNPDWDELTCEDVSSISLENQCQFITSKCQDHQIGILNHYRLYYCSTSSPILRNLVLLPLITTILVFLFIWLGLTAGEFLCPNLSAISNYLQIPENISGLTLLAFGNGSPDIMSTYSSFQTDNASLAIGELIGAAFFITSFIIGAIAVVHPFSLISETLLENDDLEDTRSHNLLSSNDKAVYVRDLGFFLLTVVLTAVFLKGGHLTKPKMLILIFIYVIYVAVVTVWQFIVLGKHKRLVEEYRIRNMYDDNSVLDISGNNLEFEDRYSFNPMILNNIEFGRILNSLTQKQTVKIKLSTLASYRDDEQGYESRSSDTVPDGNEEEEHQEQEYIPQEKGIPQKIFEIVTSPIQLLLQLTTPLMKFDDYNTKVKFGFNHFIMFLSSVFMAQFVFVYSFIETPTLTTYLLTILISFGTTFLAYHTFTTSSSTQSNLVKLLISFMGFVAAISWIGVIAEELINVLKFFSVLTHLSDAILGLTIFAIGNSTGDLISNLIIARLGYPLMALAACFGGPLLNLLLGIGVNGLIAGGKVEVSLSSSLYLSCLWVFLNLVFILIWVPGHGWKFDRMTGFIMMVIWFVGTFISVLVELFLI